MAKKKKKKPTSVDSLRHQDNRKNIPTEELRDFVREDDEQPKTMLYPRDPSLDPQLVWQGKDQQDREPLEVPVVPIYIQEKIHPQAIIDESAWSALYANESQPFPPPESGKIAVKVINHYGDEVLKVYDVK